jgi:osmoprotectant transport system substrate-binding protein
MRRTLALGVTALALVSLVTGGCAKPTAESGTRAQSAKDALPAIKVCSLLDAEGAVLGAMVIQMLNANGFQTVDMTKLGTPDVVRKALLEGAVDATIDYTGSGQFYHDGQEGLPVWKDAATGYAQIAKLDREKHNIAWLTPAPANNSELIAARKDFLEANGIATMDDFAKYVNAGRKVKVIGSQSWVDSPLGLKGFESAYGFKLKKNQIIALADGVTAPMLKAVAEGTNGVNFSLAYGTDGQLPDLGLLIIDDTRSVPPVYEPAAVFRGEVLDGAPEIAGILEPVFDSLNQVKLQELNRQATLGGKDFKAVAKEYLEANGFLK